MQPDDVLTTLRRHLLVDGYDLVLDLDRSRGSTLVDARTGESYLDMFTFFASNALGMNHPAMHTAEASERLLAAARHKPSNSDVYSVPQADYIGTFARVLGPDRMPWHFTIEGGALAVENALKAAFDWKSRRNEAAGRDPALGTKVLHLRHAFHGRSGYTMSLTNTDPNKTARYPAFDWPRIPSPALRFPVDAHAAANTTDEDVALQAAGDAFEADAADIACFIAEPIQGEGGDRHLSARFLHDMQLLCHEYDVLFVLDEVQTGVGMTGTPWAHQQLGLEPDLLAYGKKTHVCGVLGGGRLDEEPDHVWRVSSRINSTFGGSLVDMVRATIMLEAIERDGLIASAATLGERLVARLEELQERHDALTNARGRGLFCAVDVPTRDQRDEIRARLYRDEHVMLLGCGERSLRFRPALTVTEDELDRAVDALDRTVKAVTS
jgi:L-lysine 6-transaminase